jgi:hypothetical protein
VARDAVAGWFRKTSGIPDAHGRVGFYPGRIEAERMTLDGYAPRRVTWWETASGATAVECVRAQCSASLRYDGAPGSHTLRIRYFDYPQGTSGFRLSVAFRRSRRRPPSTISRSSPTVREGSRESASWRRPTPGPTAARPGATITRC